MKIVEKQASKISDEAVKYNVEKAGQFLFSGDGSVNIMRDGVTVGTIDSTNPTFDVSVIGEYTLQPNQPCQGYTVYFNETTTNVSNSSNGSGGNNQTQKDYEYVVLADQDKIQQQYVSSENYKQGANVFQKINNEKYPSGPNDLATFSVNTYPLATYIELTNRGNTKLKITVENVTDYESIYIRYGFSDVQNDTSVFADKEYVIVPLTVEGANKVAFVNVSPEQGKEHYLTGQVYVHTTSNLVAQLDSKIDVVIDESNVSYVSNNLDIPSQSFLRTFEDDSVKSNTLHDGTAYTPNGEIQSDAAVRIKEFSTYIIKEIHRTTQVNKSFTGEYNASNPGGLSFLGNNVIVTVIQGKVKVGVAKDKQPNNFVTYEAKADNPNIGKSAPMTGNIKIIPEEGAKYYVEMNTITFNDVRY